MLPRQPGGVPRAVDRWILQGVQQGVVTAAQLDNIIDIHVVVGARVNPMSGGCIRGQDSNSARLPDLTPPRLPREVAGTEHVTRS